MNYEQKEMTLDNVFSRAWKIGKEHWGALTGLGFVTSMSGQIISYANPTQQRSMETLVKIMQGDMAGAKALENAPIDFTPAMIIPFVIALIITVALSVFLTIVTFRYIKIILDDKKDVDFTEILKQSLPIIPSYFIKLMVYGLICAAGFICFFIPGIYLAIRYMFVYYIAANEPELTLKETLAKSWNMTNGRFFQLFGYGIMAFLVGLSGLFLCCIGVLFTSTLTYVIFGETYNAILRENAENQ